MSNSILGRAPEDSAIIQAYGMLGPSRLGLGEGVRMKSIGALNQLVAHTMALRDLYKEAHWQTSGATFYGLHLIFDKHYGEQLEIMDAPRRGECRHSVETRWCLRTTWWRNRALRALRGRERVADQLRRLLDAQEIILQEARPLAREAAPRGDDGTNDLVISQVSAPASCRAGSWTNTCRCTTNIASRPRFPLSEQLPATSKPADLSAGFLLLSARRSE